MAGSGAKTEKPTPKRMQEARERGQVAKSQDLNAAIGLCTATLLMCSFGPYTFTTLTGMVRHTLSHLPRKSLSFPDFSSMYASGMQSILLLLLPFFLGVTVMAILINLLQVKPLFSPKAIQPKFDKLNPLNGFKRIWSQRSVVEIVKALIKMAIVGGSATIIIFNHSQMLLGLGGVPMMAAWMGILKVIGEIALWSSVIFLVLGLVDWWYQYYSLQKQLRMSRQEIKDERKNAEGDPAIKGKMRQAGMQMVRKRQLAAVPTADVVITNPTHFSVAIKYDPDLAPAPRVIAKGQDHFALKIRELAKEHDVPVIENKPVARALYASVEVDHMIPPELFVAVAEILAFVFSKRKGRGLKR